MCALTYNAWKTSRKADELKIHLYVLVMDKETQCCYPPVPLGPWMHSLAYLSCGLREGDLHMMSFLDYLE